MSENIEYWVWLSSLAGINPGRRLRLIECFGSPGEVWKAGERQLRSLPFLTAANVSQLLDTASRKETGKILKKLQAGRIKAVTLRDAVYPGGLRNIYDPPIVLYVKGSLCENEDCLAVVGSRAATGSGRQIAEELASGISRYGITVVSGIARGIDSAAHKGAMRYGGRTIGVLGCGIDIDYPPENGALIERITSHGAVISEYVPGVKPLAFNFPARNRIISGMSLGVVVVEAGARSGSLITAELALDQGREVFAVPGSIGSENSKGVNKLIKDGAKLVTCVEDILEGLNPFLYSGTALRQPGGADNSRILRGLSQEERKVAEYLLAGALHIDELKDRCGMDMPVLSSLLTMMELKGIVGQAPGKVFSINV